MKDLGVYTLAGIGVLAAARLSWVPLCQYLGSYFVPVALVLIVSMVLSALFYGLYKYMQSRLIQEDYFVLQAL